MSESNRKTFNKPMDPKKSLADYMKMQEHCQESAADAGILIIVEIFIVR